MSKTKKAHIDYSNGWKLILPKEGNAAMLLLEYLAGHSGGQLLELKVEDDRESNSLNIILRATQTVISAAKNYINANL